MAGVTQAAAAASSSSQIKGDKIPIVDCPKCQIPVLKLRSKQPDTYDWIFYKCENNYKGDSKCNFFKWENEYLIYLRQLAKNGSRGISCDEANAARSSASIEVSTDLFDLKKGNIHCMAQILEVKQDLYKLQRQMDEQLVEVNRSLNKLQIASNGTNVQGYSWTPCFMGMCVGVLVGIIGVLVILRSA